MLLLLTSFMLRHWKYTEMVWKMIILEGQISWDKIYTPGKWGQKEAIEDGWTKILRSKLIREQNEMSGQQVEKDVIKSHVIVSLHCKIEAQVKTLFHTFVNQMPEHFEFYSAFRVSAFEVRLHVNRYFMAKGFNVIKSDSNERKSISYNWSIVFPLFIIKNRHADSPRECSNLCKAFLFLSFPMWRT